MVVSAVGTLLAFGTVAFLTFDLLGGAMFVRRREAPSAWLKAWARGATVQWLVWVVSVTVLLVTARRFGPWGALSVFALLQLVLAATRGRMARIVSQLRVIPLSQQMRDAITESGLRVEQVMVVDTPDEGFVGGWTGIRATSLMVPSRWSALPAQQLTALLVRRRLISSSGAHLRGVLGAVLWNCAGFALVLGVTQIQLTSSADFVVLMAGMTLWAFVGVLLLPTPSRAAVFEADRVTASERGVAALWTAIETVDRMQDDEPTRARWVERIFHPVPGRAERRLRLTAATTRVPFAPGFHHLARHALWLNWATLTPISRAVHCNVGRPALWVMLPGD